MANPCTMSTTVFVSKVCWVAASTCPQADPLDSRVQLCTPERRQLVHVVAEGVAQLLGHEADIAGGGEQVFETVQEFIAHGDFGGQGVHLVAKRCDLSCAGLKP